jgi:hypothetical protein
MNTIDELANSIGRKIEEEKLFCNETLTAT